MATRKRRKKAGSSSRYVREFQSMLDDLNEIIDRANCRGFQPSFVVSFGVIRNISMAPIKPGGVDARWMPDDEDDEGEEVEL